LTSEIARPSGAAIWGYLVAFGIKPGAIRELSGGLRKDAGTALPMIDIMTTSEALAFFGALGVQVSVKIALNVTIARLLRCGPQNYVVCGKKVLNLPQLTHLTLGELFAPAARSHPGPPGAPASPP
jgi:hypothetical protein